MLVANLIQALADKFPNYQQFWASCQSGTTLKPSFIDYNHKDNLVFINLEGEVNMLFANNTDIDLMLLLYALNRYGSYIWHNPQGPDKWKFYIKTTAIFQENSEQLQATFKILAEGEYPENYITSIYQDLSFEENFNVLNMPLSAIKTIEGKKGNYGESNV